jgi:hypothetical protein
MYCTVRFLADSLVVFLEPQYSLAFAVAFLSHVSPSVQFTHYANSTSCDLIGDSDVYGIGVRISYYLAYFAGVAALLANHKTALRDCRRGVNIISVAVLVSVIRNTIQGSFALSEWNVVFPMALILPMITLIPTYSGEILEELVRTGVTLLIWSIYSVLQPWL